MKYEVGTFIFYVHGYTNNIIEEKIMMLRGKGDYMYYHLLNDDYLTSDTQILAARIDGKIVMNEEYVRGIEEELSALYKKFTIYHEMEQSIQDGD